jgi:hypothetical protein
MRLNPKRPKTLNQKKGEKDANKNGVVFLFWKTTLPRPGNAGGCAPVILYVE